jgi:hypothetical protein
MSVRTTLTVFNQNKNILCNFEKEMFAQQLSEAQQTPVWRKLTTNELLSENK